MEHFFAVVGMLQTGLVVIFAISYLQFRWERGERPEQDERVARFTGQYQWTKGVAHGTKMLEVRVGGLETVPQQKESPTR